MENIIIILIAVVILTVIAALSAVFVRLPIVKYLAFPTALIGGFTLLVLGPQVLNLGGFEQDATSKIYAFWQTLPGLLINVVFAGLFFGKKPVGLKKIWKMAGPQVAFGQFMAWGQYLVGGLLTLLVLVPFFGASIYSAVLIEASFEGGHGTIAGLAHQYADFGFTDGYFLGNALATASLISAMFLGMIFVHIGRARKWFKPVGELKISKTRRKIISQAKAYLRPFKNETHKLPNFIKLVFMYAIAIFSAQVLLQGLIQIESQLGFSLFSHLPLFTVCMLTGLVVNSVCHRFGVEVSKPINSMVSDGALNFLVISAVASLSLSFLSENMAVFLLIFFAGIVWLTFSLVVVARRMIRRNWFVRAMADYGQTLGTTATGLIFAHLTDPKDKTKVFDSFGYMQLVVEPFFGGGILTAIAVPFLAAFGLPIFITLALTVCLFWLLFGILVCKKM